MDTVLAVVQELLQKLKRDELVCARHDKKTQNRLMCRSLKIMFTWASHDTSEGTAETKGRFGSGDHGQVSSRAIRLD